MPELAISLFGPIQVTAGGRQVSGFESDKVRALLAYLAVEADQPHRREKLAALLWPDMPEATARGNLRHALANLRQIIGDHDGHPPYLLVTRQTIQFNAQSDYFLDADLFVKNQQTHSNSFQQNIELLEKNVALYREDFLAGFSIPGSIAFEEWMLVKRELYRRQMMDTLQLLAKSYEQRGRYEEAIVFAHSQVSREPWSEIAHRQLMRLLALDGRRSAALAQYENCREMLQTELGVPPTAVTTNLYERIRDQTWPDEAAKTPLPLFVSQDTVDPAPSLFVARDQELRQLNDLLKLAITGKSQVAFINGEAGSGKTALLNAFARKAMAGQPNLLVAGGKCSAYTGRGDPYQPFLEITNMLTADVESSWEAGDISTDHARRLWSILPQSIQFLVEDGRLLLDRFVSAAALLRRAQARTHSLGPGNLPWLDQLSQWVQSGEMAAALSQTDLFEQFLQLLGTLAKEHSLLIWLDDLQWIDQGSLNFLFHLGQHLQGRGILILGAYRPEDLGPDLNGDMHPLKGVINEFQRIYGHDQLDLGQAAGRPFIDALLDSEPNELDEEFRRGLFSQTGGHALFTVELLNGLRERGDLVKNDAGFWQVSSQLDWEILPARVEAAIAGRIKRLPPDCQSALTVASVEGESFTAEVIAHIQNTSEQETLSFLSGDLSREHYLVTAQSRQQLGHQHFSRYRFQHFLIQHYLYNDLDPVERAGLHEAVGDTLEQFYGAQEEDLAAIFGRLAWHYQEAGVWEKAIEYCRKAGDRAWKLSAAEEAVSFYKQGLAALQKLPVSAERKQQELTLLMGLAMPLHALKGFAAAEVQDIYDRAYQLSRQVGETTHLFFTQSALGSYYMTSARYHKSLDLGQRNFKIGQNLQDELKMALSRLIMAANYSQLGEFEPCREHLDKLLDFYDPRQHHALFMHFGIDPGVNGLVWEVLVLWIQGYPEQAEQKSLDAINLANLLDHPFSQTTALEVGAGIMHILARRFQAAGSNLKGSLEIADRQQFGLFQVEGRFYEGFVLVAGGRINEGLEQMQHSLAAWRATGMRIMHSVMLGLLAQALFRAGKVAEGLKTIEEAFSWVEERDERIYEAELYHIQGNLLQRMAAETAVVESAYRQAITIARRQGAKSWELRAAISLAKLYKAQGRLPEANSLLSDVFNWFTEGFTTPDLQDASKLLAALKTEQDFLQNGGGS